MPVDRKKMAHMQVLHGPPGLRQLSVMADTGGNHAASNDRLRENFDSEFLHRGFHEILENRREIA
jgi:hypothetical protein